MMRRVLRYRLEGHVPGYDAADYMAITASRLRAYRGRAGVRRWDEEALLRAFKWAGHVARFSRHAPSRLAHKVLHYRDSKDLATMEALYGQQGHNRRLRVWRWEQQFTMNLGSEWVDYALMGEQWEELQGQWLNGRKKQVDQS